MVTAIIPLYNKEKEIAKAIDSVLNQSFSNFELIIVNDGSTDKSPSIAQSFKDERIRFFSKKNDGVSSARNFGIKKANYDLISFLDGDDWWAPDFLETLVNLQIKYRDAGIYAGQYVQVNKRGELIRLARFPNISEGYFDIFSFLYAACSSSIIVKKEVFETIGLFDESLTHGEDTDLWIRMGLKYRFCYTNKVVSYYNIAGNPLTRSVGKLPPINKHFVKKIDAYFIEEKNDWNDYLIQKKGKYLEKFYQRRPFSKETRFLINSLPEKYFIENPNTILNQKPAGVFFKNLILLFPRIYISKIRNVLKNNINLNTLFV